jgi:hypothetical protein
MRKGPLPTVLRFYFRLGFALLWVAMCMIPAVLHPTVRNLLESLMPAAFGPAIVLLQLYMARLGFGREYRRSAAWGLPATVDIDNDGLRWVTPESDNRSSWRLYLKYTENESTFVLFQRDGRRGSQAFVPIPKRSLTSGQIDEVRSVLAAHLPQS